MRLPAKIRQGFRRHGQAGGCARAARMEPAKRQAVARRAATARWIRARFGVSSFQELGLPGGDMVDSGLTDLVDGKVTEASLAVTIAAPRLRREGVPISSVHTNAEDRLYDMLSQRDGGLAHARYGAYLREMASFANACSRARIDRGRRAP